MSVTRATLVGDCLTLYYVRAYDDADDPCEAVESGSVTVSMAALLAESRCSGWCSRGRRGR